MLQRAMEALARSQLRFNMILLTEIYNFRWNKK